MSHITEEQRRRIEENRRKALERRAAALGSGNSATSLQPAVQSNTNNLVAKQFYQTPAVTKPLNSNTVANKAISFHSSNSNGTFGKPKTSYNPTATVNNIQGIKSIAKPFGSKDVVKGACILLSRRRFYVDVRYHKELIDTFKTVPSKLYDMQTKKWNFLLEDHEKLINSVKPLQPDVLIVPLPRLITKIFSNPGENRVLKQHDLSHLDSVLLTALLPFQKDGVNFAIQHNGRVLIADDMGLGKTIQAIAIANYYFKDWPLLVVTPSSVRYSWEEAFHRWLPSLDRQEVTVINSGKDHIPNNKVILISYDLLTKMKDTIVQRKFRSMILDESHFLKNQKSARTKAAVEIMRCMNRIVMLTGTPALSRPIELYTQLSALRPNDFFTFMEYGMRYCSGTQTNWGWDFNGSSNMEELQILLEETLMIRRLKSEVIKQLPAKFRQMIILDPSLISTKSKALNAISKRMQEVNLKGMERRGVLLEYFHETGEVKLRAICEYILDLLEADKKFLCFAHHQNVIKGICDTIDGKNVDYIRIDGSVSAEQRKLLCDRFQVNNNCKVAVLSITSANMGITLTAASLVVFAELFWNPGILTQAEDRAHRIGQEDSVVVQYLVAKGTADDEIWPLVQRKLDILNKAGLSKDNFKTADTINREDILQPRLDDFWDQLNDSVDILDITVDVEVPEKRLKLDA